MINWNNSNLDPINKKYKILLEQLLETIFRKHDCGCMEICRCNTTKEKLEAIEDEARDIQDIILRMVNERI